MFGIDVYAKSLIGMARFIEVFDFFINPHIFDSEDIRSDLLEQIECDHGTIIKEVVEKILCKYNLKNLYNKFEINNKAVGDLLENNLLTNYLINEYLDDEKIRELDQITLDSILMSNKYYEEFDFVQFNFYLEQESNIENKELKALERLFLNNI